MSIVSTSRKPAPELRSLAKDFAFAAGCLYIVRGKMGLPDIDAIDPALLIFSQVKGELYSLHLSSHGSPVAAFLIPAVTVTRREGPLVAGIVVGDPSIYERLKPYIAVKLSEACREGTCVFDGTRSRRYLLSLEYP